MRRRSVRGWKQVGMQQQLAPPQEVLVQQTGDTVTQPRYDLALGNWVQVIGSGAGAGVPHTQSASPTNTAVMAVTLMPQTTGIFFVSTRLSWSLNTTGLSVTHALVARQGTSQGNLSVGQTSTKIGQYAAAGQLTATGNTFTASGTILAVDATGGAGITFEGANLSAGTTQHVDVVATLTGLLTANGLGTNNFEFSGYVDAGGPNVSTKSPFNFRQPVCFAVLLTVSGAAVLSYDSTMLFAQETVTT